MPNGLPRRDLRSSSDFDAECAAPSVLAPLATCTFAYVPRGIDALRHDGPEGQLCIWVQDRRTRRMRTGPLTLGFYLILWGRGIHAYLPCGPNAYVDINLVCANGSPASPASFHQSIDLCCA